MLRLEDLQMPQRRVIECQKIAALVERNAGEMLHIAPQILREVMQRATRRANGGGFIFQPETVERGNLKMLPYGEKSCLRRESPVVVAADDSECAAQQIAERNCFRGENDFRRAQPFKFGEQRGIIFQFGRQKIAGGQIHQRQAKDFSAGINGRQKIIPFGDQHPFVEMRARRKDLRDLALHQFAGPGFLGLIADGHLASGF